MECIEDDRTTRLILLSYQLVPKLCLIVVLSPLQMLSKDRIRKCIRQENLDTSKNKVRAKMCRSINLRMLHRWCNIPGRNYIYYGESFYVLNIEV